MRIVIDTNILLVSISSRSAFHPIYKAILDGTIILCVSNSILEEYEEIIAAQWNAIVADNVLNSILKSPHTHCVDPRFHWPLIVADPDDDKFVNCAVAANALYLASDDKHFDVLSTNPFPPINLINSKVLLEVVLKAVSG